MDASQKLLSDFSSWYWWVSVVMVGLAVNLLSAFLKQPLDRWWEKRSDKARAARLAKQETFYKSVHFISSDSTLLMIWGQRLHTAEIATSMGITAIGVGISIMFFMVRLDPVSSLSALRNAATFVLGAIMFFLLVFLTIHMRRHIETRDKVFAARQLFAKSLRDSRARNAA